MAQTWQRLIADRAKKLSVGSRPLAVEPNSLRNVKAMTLAIQKPKDRIERKRLLMVETTVAKRSSKRTPLFLRGSLEGESVVQDVRVRDISVDGALLDAVHPFDIFEPITLVCGQSRINGIVAWSKDGRIGVEFSEPVRGKTLTDSFRNELRVSAPKNYRINADLEQHEAE